MRFTLSSTALSSKLSALSKVINSKNALPILGDFVFEINDNILYLTASDSENVMKSQLELTESDGSCRFAISNNFLLEAVKGLSEQPITFDVNQEGNLVKISYQNGLFNLPIENADEFPMAQPISDDAYTISIPNVILAENVARTIFATAQDELRPVMNGIFFDLTADCLSIVASDGHKLVRNKLFSIRSEQPASFILPKKPANLLKNLLGKDGGDVLIRGLSENLLRADWHRFGANGLVVVNSYKGQIGGVKNTWKQAHVFKKVKNMDLNTKESGKFVSNLKGEVVNVPPEGRVIYTNDELEDWFELARMCEN